MASFLDRVAGVVFALVVFLPLCFGGLFLLVPITPFLFVPIRVLRRVSRRLVDWVVGAWFLLVALAAEYCGRVRIVVSGDVVPRSERALIILNHPTHLDWMFFWSYLARMGSVSHCRIVMKRVLGKVPISGWFKQLALSLFLHRNWAVDEKWIKLYCEYMRETDCPIQMIFFPEGTDFNSRHLKKSHEFSKKHGLPLLHHTLQPRVRGMHAVLDAGFDAVWDCTVNYMEPVHYAPDIVSGRFPREFHVHCERVAIKDVPKEVDALEQWLRARWLQKERRMEVFADKGEFVPSNERVQSNRVSLFLRFLCSLLFFASTCTGGIYLLFACATVRWTVLAVIVAFLLNTRFGHFLEALVVFAEKRTRR